MCVVVGHAGWMSAAHRLVQGLPVPTQAAEWPAPVPYGRLLVLRPWKADTPMPATIKANATA